MKRISIIAFVACALLNTACENDATLEETRVAETTAPSVSLSSVAVDKYDATFVVNLDAEGIPATREYGILVSQEEKPVRTNSTILVAPEGESTATLVASLSPGTVYYACAYALTANNLVTSEVRKFETEAHKLKPFLGTKELSGFNLHAEEETSITVNIAADDKDENVAYLSGLKSNAGVQLDLATVKLIFDLDAGTVTIPDKQIAEEKKYGNYQYVGMDEHASAVVGDVVGKIEGKNIRFNSLAAIIIAGNNKGLFHWAYMNINIQ